MNVLLSLLIVAIDPDAPIEPRYPGAAEVFHCAFDESWDKNFDGEPDGWVRRRGRGFPRYVTVRIREESAAVGSRCLRVDLDGGGAVAYSPPIPVGPLHDYVLEGMLATEGLEHDQAFFSLNLLDRNLQRLETVYSDKVRDSQGWNKLRLGPIAPRHDNTRFAVVGLHLEPGARADLTGSARFDDVWLGRLPRIAVSANNAHHVFTDADQITVLCKASGFSEKDPPVVFQLEDPFGRQIAQDRQRLKTSLAAGRSLAIEDSADVPLELVGSAEWKPPVPGPGFYRVRVTMQGRQGRAHRRQLTLAVVRPEPGPPASEFGWSLPQGDKPLPLSELSQLILQAGIGWVKYPLWYDDQTSSAQMDDVIRFGERLAAGGIELVGLLSDPPQTLRKGFDDLKSPAEVFTADPKTWYPSLESVMTRMATQVRWWQLGQDQDTGFVGYPKLAAKMAEIKAQLDRLSHDVKLGFGWGWMNQLPEAEGDTAAWRFLAMSADPPLTHQELAAYLDATKQPQLRRWVVLEPLSRQSYGLSARAIDLVQRMMSAKIHGAEGIFIPDPFSTDHGLMNDDGTAGELLLPWRTTARMLGGTEDMGSIQLPGGSPNRMFAGFEDAVMVVWNDTPQNEVIYLGHDVRQVDLWGRTRVPESQEHRQVIEVGPLPTFITGVDKQVARWRQAFVLGTDQIPSVASGRHQTRLRIKNVFDEGVSGRLDLGAPESWELNPRGTDFRLLRNEDLEQTVEITFPYSLVSGRHLIRADFEVYADRMHRFSVYRHVDVGEGDVYIQLVTRLNDRGELEVEQHLVNDTQQPVSFRCHLFAPERRRQKTQILGLGRGRDVNTYRLADGEKLLGKTLWLRAEQIDGPRVLNYRFIAKG